MPRPVIALLTDFGSRDHYAGTMKGVIAGICADAHIIDITHDVPPQDVHTAALELAASCPYFPPDTVFLVVVDPGVGSPRRAVGVRAGAYSFVAPDNGVLFPTLQTFSTYHAVELSNSQYARPAVSRTFEGRDRFAPAAAWLATGVELDALGPVVDTLEPLALAAPRFEVDGIVGEVIHVDHFGNLITNIDQALLTRLGESDTLVVSVGNRRIVGVTGTYGETPAGRPCAIVGSSNRLELAVNGGSALAALGLDRGTVVRVARRT